MQSKRTKLIGVFLLLVLVFSSVFYWLIIAFGKLEGDEGRLVTGIMWCPGLAAFATYFIFKVPMGEIGWSPGKRRFLAWGYLIPLAYVLVGYAFIWVTGLGGFPNPEYIHYSIEEIGMPFLPAWLEVALFIGVQATFGFVRSCANALGEEIGWRGLLVPQLYEKHGYTRTSLVSGVIWAVWHFPVILFADYNEGTAWWYDLTCFTLLVVAMSFALTWLRMRSGSIWPTVFLHGAHNLFIQDIFSPLTIHHRYTAYAADEFGFVLPLLVVGIAWWFWRRRGELPRPMQTS